MSTAETWAERLADVAAPDEIDLAPTMMAAYLSGGTDRRELFLRGDSTVVGGFATGAELAIMPYLIQGLQIAGAGILSLLTADAVGNALGTVNGLLALRAELRRDKSDQPDSPAPPDTAPISAVARVVAAELRRSGIDGDRADLATLRVLRALLDEPDDARVFLEVLLAAPPPTPAKS